MASSDTTKTDEFLGTARKRFEVAAEEEKSLREKIVSDLKFASPDGDDQWDPLVKQEREAARRPAMSPSAGTGRRPRSLFPAPWRAM